MSRLLGHPEDRTSVQDLPKDSITPSDISLNNAGYTATPITTTEYILTVTSDNGCTSHDTVKITVGNINAVVTSDTVITLTTAILAVGNPLSLIAVNTDDLLTDSLFEIRVYP